MPMVSDKVLSIKNILFITGATMKNVIMTLTLAMLSTTAFSFEPDSSEVEIKRTIICSSKTTPLKAVISINQRQRIENIKVGTMEVFTMNNGDVQTLTTKAEANEMVELSPFLTGLRQASGVTNYAKTQINLITTKEVGSTQKVTAEEQLEILADDGAGIAFIEFSNRENRVVGNALFAGWAGIFTECK